MENANHIQFIDQVPNDFWKDKTVILRSSLNVPFRHGKPANLFRIKKALDSIRFLSGAGAKVVVIAHIGRNPEVSLEPVFEEMKKYILQMRFAHSFKEVNNLLSKTNVVLLENLRQFPGEVNNDLEFAQEIAKLGEVFVQDAFSVCHRNHASMVTVPKLLPSFGGLLFKQELLGLERIRQPESESLFVLGGAKFDTKEKLIQKLLEEFDNVLIVGALLNDFLKAKGLEVGESLVSDKAVPKELVDNPKIILPEQVSCIAPNHELTNKKITEIAPDEIIVDAFVPDSLANRIKKDTFKTIVWNGPFGFYEKEYVKGSYEFIKLLFDAKSAYKVAGGGDSVALIQALDAQEAFDFISTGGGAMLEFILKEFELPGLKALM